MMFLSRKYWLGNTDFSRFLVLQFVSYLEFCLKNLTGVKKQPQFFKTCEIEFHIFRFPCGWNMLYCLNDGTSVKHDLICDCVFVLSPTHLLLQPQKALPLCLFSALRFFSFLGHAMYKFY